MADMIAIVENFDLDGAVGIGWGAKLLGIGKAIRRAKLTVDAVENTAELLGRVGIKHGAAGGVGHGFKRVFAGRVSTAFTLDRANNDGIEERVRTDRFLASGVEVGAARGFAGVGD